MSVGDKIQLLVDLPNICLSAGDVGVVVSVATNTINARFDKSTPVTTSLLLDDEGTVWEQLP